MGTKIYFYSDHFYWVNTTLDNMIGSPGDYDSFIPLLYSCFVNTLRN